MSAAFNSSSTPNLAANGGGGNAAAAQGQASAAPPFDHAQFVFNFDLVLLAVLAVFVLFALPRVFTRYTHIPEWFQGLILRSTENIEPPVPVDLDRGVTSPSRAYTRGHYDPEKEHGPYTQLYLSRNKSSGSAHANLLRNTSTSSGRVRRANLNLPSHMPGWPSMVPWLSHYLRFTVRPGLTVGKLLIALAYTVGVLYVGLYKANPFTTPVRAGWVATSQIPVIIVLATKNNIPGMMLGFSYERFNFFHRWAGRLAVLAMNVHALGYIYAWTAAGTFATKIAVPRFTAGLIATIGADILYVFSITDMRNRFYTFFLWSHVVGVGLLLGGLAMHSADAVPYVLVATGAYALDRVLRIVKTRYAYAHLSALSELGMTKIEVPALNAGWRAGQHVRVRFVSFGLGWFGWCEVHPFTIASVSKNPNDEGMVLMCKKAGNWTNRLFEFAKREQYGEAAGYQRAVRVLIEGPYGGPGHVLWGSFSGSLFVCGGSGITFGLGALQDLVLKDLRGESRLKVIELVWIVQDPAMLLPLMQTFTNILTERTYATVRISVFYTQAGNAVSALKTFSSTPLPAGLTLHAGRPKLAQTLSQVVDAASALSMFKRGYRKSGVEGEKDSGRGPCGVIVGVCGPGALADDVRRVVSEVDPKRRKQVGGVEIHEETFGN